MSQWEVQPAYSQARPHDCYDIYEVGGDGLGIPGLDNLDHATARLIVDAHNRWLAAHDAEVAATTLRDVATALASSFHPSLSDEDTISTLRVYAEEYEKEARSRRITQEDSAKDVARLLAAVRAVEEAISDIETQARFRSDWEDGRAALADEIRHALTEALEGER